MKMAVKIKTVGEASRLLAEYDKANADIPQARRRQMAIFALAPQVGKKSLEELFDRPLGTTPWVHLSWFWAMAFEYSGISHYWDEFALRRNGGESPAACLRWLLERITPEQKERLERRLSGIPRGRDIPTTHAIWTRGGVWQRDNNFTKIIILGEHLPPRDHSYSYVTEAFSPAQVEQLEREVHNSVDEEELLYPEAQLRAVEYVRHRIPEMLGWKRPTTSYKVASWFFDQPVPHPTGGFIDCRSSVNYPRRTGSGGRPSKGGRWFPPKETT
jgi:hypothetical protein